ncbi:hypothetical protein B0H13DRAFT_209903 [Mycena leptocephala]|nr:hypothetical protein B0H13DRAFT_209903 [Mycena leptocephala]
MSDLHEVLFTWPSTEPGSVIVTGTFDEWTSSVHLVKGESGFHGSTKIPWDTKLRTNISSIPIGFAKPRARRRQIVQAMSIMSIHHLRSLWRLRSCGYRGCGQRS